MQDILFERRGSAGIVTLNRPKALNALNFDMVLALRVQLMDWAADGAVSRVVVTANGERAFCAGGDLRTLYDLCRAGRQEDALQFFRAEYALNAFIKRYPKPYVSLIDGPVMGGGVGISLHGSHRVAGDRYAFAMPEVGIGFFPDAGGTYALPRLPGETGTYCALTAERLAASDGVLSGAATHRVPSSRFSDLLQALCGEAPVNAVLAAFMTQPGSGEVMPRRRAIDRLFSGDSVEGILAALDAEAGAGSGNAAWAAKCAGIIRAKSPMSLKLALHQVREGRSRSFEDCMAIEYRIVSRILYGHDLHEGVRAVIIDKDNAPAWQPRSLREVTQEEVARHFAPLPEGELVLGRREA
jgi:enoyl-CoA hydratase